MRESTKADLVLEQSLLRHELQHRGKPKIFTAREIWERQVARALTIPTDYRAHSDPRLSDDELVMNYRRDLLAAGKPGAQVLLALSTCSPSFAWSVWSQGELPLELIVSPWNQTGQVLDLCESMEWKVITR